MVHPYRIHSIYREFIYGEVCGESHIAPFWNLESYEIKAYIRGDSDSNSSEVYGDLRTLIYETEDNSLKFIQYAALYVLASNCGIIAYWFGQYKPIFNDFQAKHGAKNANGERNGQPRIRYTKFGSDKFIGLNRFIILVSFLSKILIPFLDSVTGKLKQYNVLDTSVSKRISLWITISLYPLWN